MAPAFSSTPRLKQWMISFLEAASMRHVLVTPSKDEETARQLAENVKANQRWSFDIVVEPLVTSA